MTYPEVRKAWYEALGGIYEVRWKLYKTLEDKKYETDAESAELEELLAMADKLVAAYEADDEE